MATERVNLVKALDELQEKFQKSKFEVIDGELNKLSPEARALVQRKQEVYTNVARLQAQNLEIDRLLLAVQGINPAVLAGLLCW